MNLIRRLLHKLRNWESVRRYYLLFLNRKHKNAPYYAWLLADGDRTLRLNYDLDEQSVVFDLGGYEGRWARDIFERYGCNVFVFEPMPVYADNIKRRFIGNPKVQVFPFGLASYNGEERLGLLDDGSSLYKPAKQFQTVQMVRSSDFFRDHNINHIDLMKLNIEGGEYDILEHLLESGFIKNIGNIQVQFHDIFPDAKSCVNNLREKISHTHDLTYQYDFLWENWKLK